MDREQKIYKRINEHHIHLKNLGYEVAVTFLQGSQNYNLDYEYSDIDTKSIIIPSLADIAKGTSPISKVIIMDNDEHAEVKDVRVMFEMFRKQNISYLEILFTDYKIINPKYKLLVRELLDMGDDIATINKNQLLRGVSGMSKEKMKALKHPYPSIVGKIEKYGYDPKQYHHIVRLHDFIQQIASGKKFRECLVPRDVEELLEIKKGRDSLDVAEAMSIQFDLSTLDIRKQLETPEDIVRHDVIAKLDELKVKFIELGLAKEEIPKKTSGKVYVTSDWHLRHDKIIELDNRPFLSLEGMEEKLILNWNKVVNEDDEVYILGDFSFGPVRTVNKVLKKLKGIKHLVIGNHDEFLKTKRFDRDLFETISVAVEINYKGKKVVMSHYPMLINDIPTRNIIHLHGHTHDREPLVELHNTYNVGCMLWDYELVDLDGILEEGTL